jgi:hypothetical protein
MTTSYSPNTLKLQIDVSFWPFRALSNFLEIILDSSATDSAQTTCVRDQADETASLQWLLVVVGGVSLYPHFFSSSLSFLLPLLPLSSPPLLVHLVFEWLRYGTFETKAVTDGRIQPISYSLNSSDHSVAALLPHFWDSASTLPPPFSFPSYLMLYSTLLLFSSPFSPALCFCFSIIYLITLFSYRSIVRCTFR